MTLFLVPERLAEQFRLEPGPGWRSIYGASLCVPSDFDGTSSYVVVVPNHKLGLSSITDNAREFCDEMDYWIRCLQARVCAVPSVRGKLLPDIPYKFESWSKSSFYIDHWNELTGSPVYPVV